MSISNTPLYLWVRRIPTKNVEVGIYGRETSWEWIRDDHTRGEFENLVN